MPRAVTAVDVADSIASYTLGQREAFTVLAVTFTLLNVSSGGGDNFAWLDARDPTGGIILLEPLSPGDGADMFYSLAFGAEPFVAETGSPTFWPQESNGFGFQYVSQRLPLLQLSGKCTLSVYKSAGSESPPTDPRSALASGYSIPDLHLWVDDAEQVRNERVTAGPFQLVPGANV